MKTKLIVDIIALVIYILVSLPSVTTVGIHEWLGLGIFVVFIVHVAQHGTWIAHSAHPGHGLIWARQGRLILDILIAIALTVCMVSGLLISGTVLPAFGYYAEGYYLWDPIHSISAKMLLALIIVHITLDVIMAWHMWKGSKKGTTFSDAIVEEE